MLLHRCNLGNEIINQKQPITTRHLSSPIPDISQPPKLPSSSLLSQTHTYTNVSQKHFEHLCYSIDETQNPPLPNHPPHAPQVSDKMDPLELVKVCQVLNPTNKPGRLTVIVRMGAEKLREKLPALIRAVRNDGLIVTWVCDPMHGNTVKAPNGYKTRPFEAIRVRGCTPSLSSYLSRSCFGEGDRCCVFE